MEWYLEQKSKDEKFPSSCINNVYHHHDHCHHLLLTFPSFHTYKCTHVMMPYESKNDSLILKIMEISKSIFSRKHRLTTYIQRAHPTDIMSGIISYQKKIDTRYCLNSLSLSLVLCNKKCIQNTWWEKKKWRRRVTKRLNEYFITIP